MPEPQNCLGQLLDRLLVDRNPVLDDLVLLAFNPSHDCLQSRLPVFYRLFSEVRFLFAQALYLLCTPDNLRNLEDALPGNLRVPVEVLYASFCAGPT
jgi:hypothetical protein